MIDVNQYRWEEENLVKQLEDFVLKNIKRKSHKEVELAVDKWIRKTTIKVFAREKLIDRVYNDLKNQWKGVMTNDNLWNKTR